MKTIEPQDVSDVLLAFPGDVSKLMPPYSSIPDEFKRHAGNAWVDWQAEWFFNGLKSMPTPKEGIDIDKALRHLKCIQGSFSPKHEHKSAAVAYLASQWFESPKGKA